jgi:lipopolysaccharide transport system ATP-binding protein
MTTHNTPSDILIKCENVSKKFCRNFKQSLVYGLKDVLGTMVGKNMQHDRLRKNEFWAVKDINFELRRGECLGLIGHNGAGKSTLLKMLNGLITPDQGKITMRGRIGALIELGAGFNPILTGRENIYNNGAVLGFTREEITAKLDAIIEFSEIGEFIDSPVQNYSSGMKVRLGFAVAAQMEPDILLIDEVLAVGDISFHIKCLNRIAELMKNCAIIFVSHTMPQISRICTSALLMSHSQSVIYSNEVAKVIEGYLAKTPDLNKTIIGNNKAKVTSVEIATENTQYTSDNTLVVHTNDTLRIRIAIQLTSLVEKFYVRIIINDQQLRQVLESYSRTSIPYFIKGETEFLTLELVLPNITLANGRHAITIAIANIENGEFFTIVTDAISFYMKSLAVGAATNYVPGDWRIIDYNH